MKQLFPLAAVLALAACAATPIAGQPVPSDGRAVLGQSTRVGHLVVTPQAVVEDSRCPINARCVWAGRLVLRTRIEGAGWRETAQLTLGQPLIIHGSGLALVSAEPNKLAGQPVPSTMLFAFEPR